MASRISQSSKLSDVNTRGSQWLAAASGKSRRRSVNAFRAQRIQDVHGTVLTAIFIPRDQTTAHATVAGVLAVFVEQVRRGIKPFNDLRAKTTDTAVDVNKIGSTLRSYRCQHSGGVSRQPCWLSPRSSPGISSKNKPAGNSCWNQYRHRRQNWRYNLFGGDRGGQADARQAGSDYGRNRL